MNNGRFQYAIKGDFKNTREQKNGVDIKATLLIIR